MILFWGITLDARAALTDLPAAIVYLWMRTGLAWMKAKEEVNHRENWRRHGTTVNAKYRQLSGEKRANGARLRVRTPWSGRTRWKQQWVHAYELSFGNGLLVVKLTHHDEFSIRIYKTGHSN